MKSSFPYYGVRYISSPINCYSSFMKGLGGAQRIDEAFQVLESVEKGTAVGSPQLSAEMIFGLLNALTESGMCFDSKH